jgi:hypothetical protein
MTIAAAPNAAICGGVPNTCADNVPQVLNVEIQTDCGTYTGQISSVPPVGSSTAFWKTSSNITIKCNHSVGCFQTSTNVWLQFVAANAWTVFMGGGQFNGVATVVCSTLVKGFSAVANVSMGPGCTPTVTITSP